ncbi:MAG: hypothetical protein ACLPJH_17885 [Myxococcaceae bacterium]
MKCATPLLALAVLLSTTAAWGGGTVSVEVGKTTTVEVGHAKGLNCDDLAVAQVEIRTASPETNELVITGLKPGTTYCRAGTAASGATTLVKIIVYEKKD